MSIFELKDLRQHCFDLSYFFFNLNKIKADKFSGQSYPYWLNIAAGISDVELDLELASHGTAALNDLRIPLYRDARHLNTQIVSALVIFNLIWDTYINIVNEQLRRSFTPDLVAEFLGTAYQPHKNLILYNRLVRELKQRVRNSRIINTRKVLNLANSAPRSACGIILVHQIKPHFAHGAYQFPLGSDPTGPEAIDPMIIQLSSRLVLLTIQITLIPHFEHHPFEMRCWWSQKKSQRKIPAVYFLRTVHLQGLESLDS